ncbi:ATP-binding protein [uncultured Shewanella sp.]|uniref:sensor histidine kinase n=1 Tax=uncultured Shewanella sp. TaxID=173975 RepID=UPI00262BBDCC|nr:ATP-binding protein [uncultured Shewanella sp.]
MKRLFVSLYLLLSLSFLGIGWALDSLWRYQTNPNPIENASLIAFAQLLSQLPENKRISYLSNITQFADFPLVLVDIDEFSLANEEQLKSDAVTSIPISTDSELHYIAVGNQVLVNGPLTLNNNIKLIYIIGLSLFLLIILILLIVILPLSKDLATLNTTAKQLNMAKWDTRTSLSAHSPVINLSETFNRMANNIAQLVDNQSHLLNAVSHEIRTPLSRLKFALALILQYAKPYLPNQKQLVENTNQDIDEIEALLAELLSYTSLDPQYQQPKFESVELNQLVEKTIKRLQTHQRNIITFMPCKKPVIATANAILIDRALQNLITNAQKFGHHSVTVEINQNEKEIEISVTDDGEGIPVTEREKIFEPFYRSQAKEKQGPRGYGLGLAIVKRIMDKHHGNATLKSGQGNTTFSLHLPHSIESKSNSPLS